MNPCSKCGRNAGARKTGKARKLCDACLRAHRQRFRRQWDDPVVYLSVPEEPPVSTEDEIKRRIETYKAYSELDERGLPKRDTRKRPVLPKRLDLIQSPEAFARFFGGGSGTFSGGDD